MLRYEEHWIRPSRGDRDRDAKEAHKSETAVPENVGRVQGLAKGEAKKISPTCRLIRPPCAVCARHDTLPTVAVRIPTDCCWRRVRLREGLRCVSIDKALGASVLQSVPRKRLPLSKRERQKFEKCLGCLRRSRATQERSLVKLRKNAIVFVRMYAKLDCPNESTTLGY